MTPSLSTWGGTSRTADLAGPLHYVDFGGPEDAPRIVLVHGLGGSHLNWCLLASRLSSHARVLAPDLSGFGLTHPAGRATTVQANAALLDRFLREVAGTPVILVGNSMGGMISILETSHRPDAVAGLVLVDPALPLGRGVRLDRLVAATFFLYAVPGVGERVMARGRDGLSARQLVQQVLDLCCADPSVVPEDLIEASVALAEERAGVPGLDRAFLRAARSLLLMLGQRGRYQEMMRAIRCPVFLIQGELDRLVDVGAARRVAARHPDWRFEVLPGVGHIPQLEVPDVVAGRILDWLGQESAAARAARPHPVAG